MSSIVYIRLIGPPRVTLLPTSSNAATDLCRPKAIALLAYLAVEGREVSRAELLSVLWPEKPERPGRAALSQVLHTIRTFAAPSDPIAASGDYVALNWAVVRADIREFRIHVAAGGRSAMPSEPCPELLQGFISESDTYTDWLDKKRREFALELADILWSAAEEAPHGEALELLERLARLRPFDEVVLRRRLERLEQLSDFGSALQLYEEFRRKLSTDLGTRPSAETLRVAARIVGAGEAPSVQRRPRPADCNSPADQPLLAQAGFLGWTQVAVAIVLVLLLFLTGTWLTSVGVASTEQKAELDIGDLRLVVPGRTEGEAGLQFAGLLSHQFNVRVGSDAAYNLSGKI
jgi:DNA-binding SARP family transcriptional activator